MTTDMQVELLIESLNDAVPTEELVEKILNSRSDLMEYLQSAGIGILDVTLEPPAEFPKGAKKILVKITLAFLLGAAGESGKISADKVHEYLQHRYPDATFQMKAPSQPLTPAPSDLKK
jgi:hypothetical protein